MFKLMITGVVFTGIIALRALASWSNGMSFDDMKAHFDAQMFEEQAVDIAKVVVHQIVDDTTGVTMRRLCDSHVEHRTPQGMALLKCEDFGNEVHIKISGRHYGDGGHTVEVDYFTMSKQGDSWKGPDPQDRGRPRYTVYKNGIVYR